MNIGDLVCTNSTNGWGLDWVYPKIKGVIIAINRQQYTGRRGTDTIITLKTADNVEHKIEKRCLMNVVL